MSRNDSIPAYKKPSLFPTSLKGVESLLVMLRGEEGWEVAPIAEVLKWKERGLQSTLLRMRLLPLLPQR